MRARRTAAALIPIAVASAGCGRGGSGDQTTSTTSGQPAIGVKGTETTAAQDLGFPVFATKNTTRVGGADPIADAAAIARAVYPSLSPGTRPKAVTLVDGGDWRAALAASVLMAAPIRAPVLLGEGTSLPDATSEALDALAPSGSKPAGGAQVVRIG